MAVVPKITTNHSSDAGNYGGSLPNAMVENFANVVYSMDQTDTQTTTQGQLVQLTYSPGNMNLNERFWLLGALDQFAQNQQSWHGNWFLWNVVTVSDPANHASIQLTIS